MVEAFAPRSALAGLATPVEPHGDPGVHVCELANLGLVSVLVRNGRRADLATRMAGHGLDLPDGPHAAIGDQLMLLGTGPRAWLAMKAGASPAWAEQLRQELEGVAAVADQSSAYVALRLEGPAVRGLLAKGVMVDLHPRVFAVGAVAVVSIAHTSAILWRSSENSFDLLVTRSYAADLWRWLDHSAAEFGLVFTGQGKDG